MAPARGARNSHLDASGRLLYRFASAGIPGRLMVALDTELTISLKIASARSTKKGFLSFSSVARVAPVRD